MPETKPIALGTMSSIYIAGIIIVLLIGVVCYAIIAQNLEKKRKQQQRLLSALQVRARNFKFMLSGFPPDFLTKELTILVYRCLVDVCEQLAKLDPKETTYVEELQLYSGQMEEVKRKPSQTKRKALENPQQVKEVKHHLEDLNKFIHQLQKRGSISQSQKESYSRQIKQLVLQMSVDAYLLNARQAEQSEKARLAIHYYGLARKLLVRENAAGDFQKQVARINNAISLLEIQLREEEPDYEETELQVAQKEEAREAWDKFSEDDDLWKKKRVYD